MIINPEYAAAQEISGLLRFPAAIKIDPFSRGKVELLKFRFFLNFIWMEQGIFPDLKNSGAIFSSVLWKTKMSLPFREATISYMTVILSLLLPLHRILPCFSKK